MQMIAKCALTYSNAKRHLEEVAMGQHRVMQSRTFHMSVHGQMPDEMKFCYLQNDVLAVLTKSTLANDLAGADGVLLHHFAQCLNAFTGRQLAQALAASYPWVPNVFQLVALAAAGAPFWKVPSSSMT